MLTMTKEQFIKELREKLAGFPKNEIEERLSFYSEMIDDRVEDGLSEDEAIAGIGTVDEIADQITADIPLTKIVKNKVKPKRTLKGWEIALIVLGSPIWLSLAVAAIALMLAVYIVLWTIVIVVYAIDFAFAITALCSIPGMLFILKAGNIASVIFCLGTGITCAGLAILMFFACFYIAKGILKLTKSIALGIKRAFVGKEEASYE